MKRILAVFAHPDDETFGPGGTLLTWAKKGYEIHLLCVTHGENGMNNTKHHTAHVREKELKKAAKILGIARVEFLDFVDGTIGNHAIPQLRENITAKIMSFQPHRILTFDLTGVSGHLDHIAVANAATTAFDKTGIAEELYYWTLSREDSALVKDYFIHFPAGRELDEIDKTIDVAPVWEERLQAMWCHKSQKKDIEEILSEWHQRGEKKEYFLIRRRKK